MSHRCRLYLITPPAIADMAAYPWVMPDRQGQDIDSFPNLKRWLAAQR